LQIYQWASSCHLLRVDAASKTARYYGGVVTICLSLPVNLCTWMHWRHRAIRSYSPLVYTFIDSNEIGGYDNNLTKIVFASINTSWSTKWRTEYYFTFTKLISELRYLTSNPLIKIILYRRRATHLIIRNW